MKKISLVLIFIIIVIGSIFGSDSKLGVFFTQSLNIADMPDSVDDEKGFGIEYIFTKKIFFQLYYLYTNENYSSLGTYSINGSFGNISQANYKNSHNICFLIGYKFHFSKKIMFSAKAGINWRQATDSGFEIHDIDYSEYEEHNNFGWNYKKNEKRFILGFQLEFKASENLSFISGCDFYYQTNANKPFVGIKLLF